MAVDSTFEFEARRNRPVKYDRDLVARTIGAMGRVKEIQEAREKDFYTARMEESKVVKKKEKRAEIVKGLDLIRPAAGREKAEGRRREERRERKIEQGRKDMELEG